MADRVLTPDQHARVREIFDRALSLAAGAAREAFVTTTCADDPIVQAEVMSLLEALEQSAEDWQDAVPAVVARELQQVTDRWARPAPTRVGARIGAYELVRLVGEGGMGAVFEGARIDAAFEQRVAIKFLRRVDAGDLAQRRFRHERQILASLQHPNIAALFDGGVSEDGQLYLVMEFVDGTPITQYADERRLDLRARLGLLRQVCAAVQHAHGKLVVHRDLKPGNILVTHDGQVKLLDFGIARLLRDDLPEAAAPLTADGTVPFTPEYASPEQVRGLPV
ncbi:MAG: serine/threonine protein kinase, partial [Gemmatimonadaceae bacterium]|nr:serine/threonine protein kinase [Gemmatimonadaceae bacterium]